jgi:hypothetical protein
MLLGTNARYGITTKRRPFRPGGVLLGGNRVVVGGYCQRWEAPWVDVAFVKVYYSIVGAGLQQVSGDSRAFHKYPRLRF